MFARIRGCYVIGWSPTHQQPICHMTFAGAKRFQNAEHFAFWYARQPGHSNFGPAAQFELVEEPDPIARAIDRAAHELLVDLAEGPDVTVYWCPTCRTQLAFDGDVCGLCHPDGTPEI